MFGDFKKWVWKNGSVIKIEGWNYRDIEKRNLKIETRKWESKIFVKSQFLKVFKPDIWVGSERLKHNSFNWGIKLIKILIIDRIEWSKKLVSKKLRQFDEFESVKFRKSEKIWRGLDKTNRSYWQIITN